MQSQCMLCILNNFVDCTFKLFHFIGASLLPGGPFLILTPTLSSYRRQLWISAKPVTHIEKGQESFKKPVAVWLRVEGVLDRGGHKVLVGGLGHNRTRAIQVKHREDR